MDSPEHGRRSIGVLLIGHPDFAAKGPEGARHDSWTFNFSNLSPAVEVADSIDSSGPVHRPHAAAKFTCHDHVEGELAQCALMIERNPGMVR